MSRGRGPLWWVAELGLCLGKGPSLHLGKENEVCFQFGQTQWWIQDFDQLKRKEIRYQKKKDQKINVNTVSSFELKKLLCVEILASCFLLVCVLF